MKMTDKAEKPFECEECGKRFGSENSLKQHRLAKHDAAAFEPNWDGECEVCGQSPTVSATGLCGPCTFGEADTAGGNW